MLFYPIGSTEAAVFAASLLQQKGLSMTDHPSPEITHLMLDIPSFRADGLLRNGRDLYPLLRMLPSNICIVGGNLEQEPILSYRKIDLLKDPFYLAQNASITADCALRLAGQHMNFTYDGASVLVIGWGRIGKCLARMLQALHARVFISARTDSDLAMIHALGYNAVPLSSISGMLHKCRMVFNTVPVCILEQPVPKSMIAIELASLPGLVGETVIQAQGLPGKMAPVSSGKLIADRVQTYLSEVCL